MCRLHGVVSCSIVRVQAANNLDLANINEALSWFDGFFWSASVCFFIGRESLKCGQAL